MKSISISPNKLEKLLNREIEPEELIFYRVLPNNKADKVNLNQKIIIECMMDDIDSSDNKSAFIHIEEINN